MKRYFPQTKAFAFLTILMPGVSCNGQVKKDIPKEKVSESKIAIGQPQLVKTQGSQKSDNVGSTLQDKAGNLWFGTSSEGVYKYDGKSWRSGFRRYSKEMWIAKNPLQLSLQRV